MNWISIDEKLPEEDQGFLSYNKYCEYEVWFFQKQWDPEMPEYITEDQMRQPGLSITHWMPLPDPPQGR